MRMLQVAGGRFTVAAAARVATAGQPYSLAKYKVYRAQRSVLRLRLLAKRGGARLLRFGGFWHSLGHFACRGAATALVISCCSRLRAYFCGRVAGGFEFPRLRRAISLESYDCLLPAAADNMAVETPVVTFNAQLWFCTVKSFCQITQSCFERRRQPAL